MKTILHKADTRGNANHGWLESNHTFSFANYYNPERVHFGALRVLNDDHVAPGRGFGKHPHDNMEIISIPISGDLRHEDSMGNETVIKEGDIQAMSAGTGVFHSEMNANADRPVDFLQIWVFPKSRDITPNYSQITLDEAQLDNKLTQIVSPSPEDEGVHINQDAWFHLGNLHHGTATEYELKKAGNGVYAFVLEGSVTIGDQILERRDGLGIWDTDRLDITATKDARLLLMEVPMNLN
ncbi:pirin family protein [Lewinella sp. W8]|uniref:pirin family protein n=1 Tax=Lewinella sp. W8 TaxID=2528208 RepID=UPI001067F78D|nr:pirin family protein [Lewinella sp. W8]MTB52324.1 pirin family protein [Lewinella sp. W8]